jgi:hypothetical protein
MGTSWNGSDRHGATKKKLSPIDWAKIWHAKLASFHHIPKKKRWVYGRGEVIAFLIHHKQAGAPAWKRLKIAESLTLFKAELLGDQGECLDDICDQLARLGIAKHRGARRRRSFDRFGGRA